MNKYFSDLFLCLCFYTLVCAIVFSRSELNTNEAILLALYCIISSVFFPFVANFFREIKKGDIPLKYWNNGVLTLCLILSLPLGIFLFIYKTSKR